MTDIAFSLNKEFLEELHELTGHQLNNQELLKVALVFFRHALERTKDGRIFLTCNDSGEDIRKFATSVLDMAKPFKLHVVK